MAKCELCGEAIKDYTNMELVRLQRRPNVVKFIQLNGVTHYCCGSHSKFEFAKWVKEEIRRLQKGAGILGSKD